MREPANPDARITPQKQRAGANRRLFALKRELGLSDEALRDAVERATGQRSISTLSGPQLIRVCDSIDPRKRRPVPDERSATYNRMRALWIDLNNLGALRDGSDRGLAVFVKRQCGVDDPRWVAADEAFRVIEALKKMLARAGAVEVGIADHPKRALRHLLYAQRDRLVALGALPVEPGELPTDAFARLFHAFTGKPFHGREGEGLGTMQRAASGFGRMIRAAQQKQRAAAAPDD